jgi:hypothetical protein
MKLKLLVIFFAVINTIEAQNFMLHWTTALVHIDYRNYKNL